MSQQRQSVPLQRSAFREWFKEQYGAVPSERARQQAAQRVKDLENALRVARIKLHVEESRLAAWTNAMYGWNARRP